MKSVMISIMAFFACMVSYAQEGSIAQHSAAKNLIWEKKLERHVTFLSDTICQGRGTGSRASKEAAFCANYCAEWRERCLEEKTSFVFETVMSAIDKVDFIAKAKKKGFFIRLFFISTESPKINASRIADRVMKGGHDVPITKIVSRYFKSIENCKAVSSIVDCLYVYDNSVDGEEAKIQFRLVNGAMGKMYVTDVPEWAQVILPDTED